LPIKGDQLKIELDEFFESEEQTKRRRTNDTLAITGTTLTGKETEITHWGPCHNYVKDKEGRKEITTH